MAQQRLNARAVGAPPHVQCDDQATGDPMADTSFAGHRQRLKTRFLADAPGSRSDAALLELLLTYAIPQRDVRPLAERLLAHFGTLEAALAAEPAVLRAVDGVAEHTAVLIKLCDLLRQRALLHENDASETAPAARAPDQASLFAALDVAPTSEPSPGVVASDGRATSANGAVGDLRRRVLAGRGSDLVTKSVLREAIEMLPRLPDTESLDETSAFLKANLHFSALQTRERYAAYINRRMFPAGFADRAMRSFAVAFAGQQELRDVAFYRFCRAEPLVGRVVRELLVPAISAGSLERAALRAYLAERYPESRGIKDATQAIVETLVSGGIARADRERLFFSYREVLLPSFSFIIHSEFPEPGMCPLGDLERHSVLQTMLWKPDRILPALYELRNQGLIAHLRDRQRPPVYPQVHPRPARR